MAYFLETFSYPTTGVKTRTPGFQVLGYKITVGPKNGGTSFVTRSEGSCDGTNQTCEWFYADPSLAQADARYSDRLAFVQEWNGSAFTTKVRINHDSLTATQIKFNIVTADVNYQIKLEAWG